MKYFFEDPGQIVSRIHLNYECCLIWENCVVILRIFDVYMCHKVVMTEFCCCHGMLYVLTGNGVTDVYQWVAISVVYWCNCYRVILFSYVKLRFGGVCFQGIGTGDNYWMLFHYHSRTSFSIQFCICSCNILFLVNVGTSFQFEGGVCRSTSRKQTTQLSQGKLLVFISELRRAQFFPFIWSDGL